MLAGAISALATELAYRVEKVGRSIVLIQRKVNLPLEKTDLAASISKTDQENGK